MVGSRKSRSRLFGLAGNALFLGVFGIGVPARAQALVVPSKSAVVEQIIESDSKHDSLHCHFERSGPVLDYDLRYQLRFSISTTTGQLNPGDQATVYLRVTPLGRSPVYMDQIFNVPAPPPNSPSLAKAGQLKRFQLAADGGLEIGQGRYATELLLLDQQGRTCHKQWNLDTGKYRGSVAPALQPLTVDAPSIPSWNGRLDPNGIRLEVLIDAVPFHPFAQRLSPQDRDKLLQSLALLLREIPSRSVQVVAFSLNQGTEVFRQDNFESAGLIELAAALQQSELSTVPYQTLERGAVPRFLQGLIQQSGPNLPDAVVFLGIDSLEDESPQADSLVPISSRVFYLELGVSGGPMLIRPSYKFPTAPPFPDRTVDFPDAIEHLTRELGGFTFHITSPKDLADDTEKMLAQMKAGQND